MNIVEARIRWPDGETAMHHLENVRWGGKPICPYCASEKTCVHASKDKNVPRWQCESCKRSFSATVNSFFHRTHLPLSKWFQAIAIKITSPRRITDAELSRDLDIPYKTAWGIARKIEAALRDQPENRSLFFSIIGVVDPGMQSDGKRRRKNNLYAKDVSKISNDEARSAVRSSASAKSSERDLT